MSASNWDTCPRCIDEIGTERATHDSSFREDYEIFGAQSGEIEVHYKGRCKACGLGIAFTERRRFYTPEEPNETEHAARRAEQDYRWSH